MLQRNSFSWLDYSHLGVLVDRVARGLLAADLRPGDAVAICGYALPEMKYHANTFAITSFTSQI